MTGLSCVIPAYNEAPRIEAVLGAVLGHPMIDEVVVVDDGSGDDTAARATAIARHAPHLRVIVQPRNGGKSAAVAAGIAQARGHDLLLLDADLIGLAEADLSALIAPVRTGRAEAAISLRRNAPLAWRALGLDYISGERVMARALLAPHLDEIAALPRFGLEVWMNRLWISQGARIAVVRWPGVQSPMKRAKRGGWIAGLRADARMMTDIFATQPPLDCAAQIRAMRRLARGA